MFPSCIRLHARPSGRVDSPHAVLILNFFAFTLPPLPLAWCRTTALALWSSLRRSIRSVSFAFSLLSPPGVKAPGLPSMTYSNRRVPFSTSIPPPKVAPLRLAPVFSLVEWRASSTPSSLYLVRARADLLNHTLGFPDSLFVYSLPPGLAGRSAGFSILHAVPSRTFPSDGLVELDEIVCRVPSLSALSIAR